MTLEPNKIEPYSIEGLKIVPRSKRRITGRPPIGWRTAQRKRTYAKLVKRQRSNRRN